MPRNEGDTNMLCYAISFSMYRYRPVWHRAYGRTGREIQGSGADSILRSSNLSEETTNRVPASKI